jgi:hypothetical protein
MGRTLIVLTLAEAQGITMELIDIQFPQRRCSATLCPISISAGRPSLPRPSSVASLTAPGSSTRRRARDSSLHWPTMTRRR